MIDENTQKLIHVHAFDDQNDSMTFNYKVPAELSHTVDGMNLTINAPEVTTTATFMIQVEVSDGKLTSQTSFQVTINNLDGGNDGELAAWSANTVYNGGDKVTYQGKVYRAKWWVRGDKPNSSSAWELESKGEQDEVWNANKAYTGGSIVSYNGAQYKARWWTKGDKPDTATVWQAL